MFSFEMFSLFRSHPWNTLLLHFVPLLTTKHPQVEVCAAVFLSQCRCMDVEVSRGGLWSDMWSGGHITAYKLSNQQKQKHWSTSISSCAPVTFALITSWSKQTKTSRAAEESAHRDEGWGCNFPSQMFGGVIYRSLDQRKQGKLLNDTWIAALGVLKWWQLRLELYF